MRFDFEKKSFIDEISFPIFPKFSNSSRNKSLEIARLIFFSDNFIYFHGKKWAAKAILGYTLDANVPPEIMGN